MDGKLTPEEQAELDGLNTSLNSAEQKELDELNGVSSSPKPTTSPQGAESGVKGSFIAPQAETTPYTSPSGTIVSDFGKATTSSLGTSKAVVPSTNSVGGKSKVISNKQSQNIEPSKDLTEVKSPYSVTIKNAEDKNKLNEDYSKQPESYAKVVTSFNGLISDTNKKLLELAKVNANNPTEQGVQDYNKLLASKQAFETNKAKVQGIITDKERKAVQEKIDMPFIGNFFQGLHAGVGEVVEGMKAMGLESLMPAWMNPDVVNPNSIIEQYNKLTADKKELIQALKEKAVINESKAIAEQERAKELGENPVRSYLGQTFGSLTPPLLLAAGAAVTGMEGALPAMNGALFGTMGYGASMAQGFDEAQKLGYNDEESYELAKNAARIGGTVQGVLGIVMGKTGEAAGKLNPFNKAITGSITKNAIKQGITDFGLKAIGTGAEFAGARIAENIGQKYLNPELSANKNVMEGSGEAFKSGLLLHTTMNTMHAPKQILGKASLINAVSEAKTPEDVLDLTNTIQQAKANNSITEGMATQLTQKVGRIKEAIDIVPDAFTDADVREKATELILRHQDVEEKLKKTPEALKPMVADELKAINVQFEDLRNEQSNKNKAVEENKPIKFTSGNNDLYGYVEENGVKRNLTKEEFDNYEKPKIVSKPTSTEPINYSESDVAKKHIQGLENKIASEIKYKGENKPKGVFAKIANFFMEDSYEDELKSELQAFKENPIKALEERIAKLKKYNKENPDDSFDTDYLEKDLDELKNYDNRVVEQQMEVASTEDGGGVGKDNKTEVAYITDEQGKSEPIELSPQPSELQLEEAYNELLNQSGEEGKKRIKSMAEIVQEVKNKKAVKERIELWKAEVAKARKAFEENQAKPTEKTSTTEKADAGSVGVGGDVKLEKGNKIQWNVFGNEESGEWTVGEKTKTRGGKDAVVLTKVYVEASSDGKSYTKEYADANGIKYDTERTVEHIVPLEDLQSLKETPVQESRTEKKNEQGKEEIINNDNNEADNIQPNGEVYVPPTTEADIAKEEARIADEEAKNGIRSGNEKISDIEVRPDIFQFKAQDEESGVNLQEKLQGKYDKNLAGTIGVWKDTQGELGEKGKVYVVDGHHRMEFAKRNGEVDMNVFYIDAPTAKDARVIGAKANIAQGRGTSVDAAKVYKEATPEQLEGFKPTSRVAKEGAELAKLEDSIFNLVVQGKLEIPTAIAISKVPKEKQESFYKAIKRIQDSGAITMTPKGLMVMADKIVNGNVAVNKVQEMDLFGTTETEELLLAEQSQLESDIKDELAKDAKILGSANKNKEVLEKANNVLDLEANAKLAQSSKLASGLFDTYKNRSSVADIIKQATTDLQSAKGRKERIAIREKASTDVKKAIEAELKNDFGKQEKVNEPQPKPVSKESVSPIEKIKADSEEAYKKKLEVKEKPLTQSEQDAEFKKIDAEYKVIEKTNNLMDKLEKQGLLRKFDCL